MIRRPRPEAADELFAELYDGLHLTVSRSVVQEPDAKPADEGAFVVWTVAPDADRIVPGEMASLAAAVDATKDAVDDDAQVDRQGVEASGNLAATVRKVSRSLDAALAVRPVPPLLVAAISLLMLVQLARLLTFERRSEIALVRSRGASAGQLTRAAVVEAIMVAVPAALAGVLLPAVVLASRGGSVPVLGWILALLVALVTVVLIVIPAIVQARLPANRQTIDDSGRGQVFAVGGAVLLVIGAAALSTWRFSLEGSAAVVGDDGVLKIDPVAVLAPALLLIAAALVASLAFLLGSGAAERVAERSTGLGVVLAARQVSRRVVVFGVAVLMVAIAVGSATLAAAYTRTQNDAQQRADAMRNGAALRVELPVRDPATPTDYATPTSALASVDSVGSVLSAQTLDVEVGTLSGRLTGITSDGVTAVVPDQVVEAIRPVAALGSRAAPVGGWPMPDDTRQVVLGLRAQGGWLDSDAGPGQTMELNVSLWFEDPQGALSPVRGGQLTVPMGETGRGPEVEGTVTAEVPGLAAGSRLVAMDVKAPLVLDLASLRVQVAKVSAVTTRGTEQVAADEGAWNVVPVTGADPTETGIGLEGVINPGQAVAFRLTPAGGATLPIAVDGFLARALDLGEGDALTLRVNGAVAIDVEVASVTTKLPGEVGVPRIFADLPQLSGALLRASLSVPAAYQLWIDPKDDDRAVRDVAAATPPGTNLVLADSRSVDALLAPAAQTLWFGSAGALLLAAIGVGGVIATLSQTRRGELVVLRAVGITARQQSRARRRELFSVLSAGWLLGILVGGLTVLATVPGLAGSALVDSGGDAIALHLDLRNWLLLVGAHVAVVVGLVLVHSVRLRREVALATPSEVER